MKNAKEVYRSVKLTDDVKMTSLSVMDQLRLIFSKVSNDDISKLDTHEKLSAERLKKVVALSTFIDKATKRLRDLGQESVTVSLSSEFLPYLDEVIDDERGKGRYYHFEVYKKHLPAEVSHKFIMTIRRK